jgi:CheY-like chemotaxis protein
MKRRILLVDDDLAVLLTLKAVLELHGFEIETAGSSVEAVAQMESGVYHMVISDLRMETEEAGLEVIRAARRQSYAPATALLTAFPPSDEYLSARSAYDDAPHENHSTEISSDGNRKLKGTDQPDCLLVKPLGTSALVRQIEAMLIRHADRKELLRRNSVA